MLFGVAGGMAEWFDLDPSLVRLVWALLILAGGIGLLLYIVAAIVIPEEPVGGFAGAPDATSGDTAAAAAGTVGAGAGSAAATDSDDRYARRQARRAARAQRMGNGGGAILFGLILIALGGWFLLQRFLPSIDADVVWPVVLLLVGGALVVGALRR